LLLGIQTEDEIVDIQPVNITPDKKGKVSTEEVKGQEGEPSEFRDGQWRETTDNPKVEVDDGFAGF